MKKLFLFALVTMMSLVANAQQLKVQKNMTWGAQAPTMLQAPAKAPAIEGTDLWGYYLGNNTADWVGLGTGSAGSFRVAIFVPGDGVLKGTKIRGLNIPGVGAMTNVSGWVSTKLTTASYVASKTVGSAGAGYTVLEFDEPVEIPETGLYAGYTFSSSNAYPIATTGDDTQGGLYLAMSATGALENYSLEGFGVSALQVFVEGMVLPDNFATVSGVAVEACAAGGKGTAVVTLASNGSKGVKNIDYTLVVNGVETTGTKTFSPSVAGGLNKTASFNVEFDAPAEVGAFNASVAINKVNGVENEAGATPKAFTINTVTRVVPRMTVIEEFTGTGCGWCPRGWVGMEAVKHNQSDKALVIAWHNYNSSDAMYQANYAAINFSGAPQCTVDRKVYPDPYYGEGEEGIMNCVNKFNTTVPTVDVVELKANFTDDTNKQVYITSNTEFLTNTSGYTIAFVLTADNLTGTTTAWKQTNYYYQNYNKSTFTGALPDMPELAEFCKGGEYGKSSVQLTFNDALIGSTYNSTGKSLVPAFTKGQAGDVEASEYTLAMPTKAALVNALDYENIYVTALVIDKNGQIANAARVRVLGAGETGDDNDDPAKPIEIDGLKISGMSETIQVMGEAMSPNAKYVVGANFATYAPVVWNVETDAITDFADYEEGSFHAANSNGLFVGDDGMYAAKATINEDGEGVFTELYFFEGEEIETEWGTMSTGDAGSSAYAVSEDGKTIAGFYFDSSYKTTPCIWTANNERVDLPLPTAAEAGFDIDGGEVRYMTPDGKLLVGFLMDNMSTWPACIWRKNEAGGYDYDVICKNYWEESYQQGKPYMVFNPSGVSANGEWIALQIQKEFDDWDFSTPQPALQIARLNLTTGALEVLESEDGYTPTGIANDGTMLAYTGGNDMMGRAGYIWPAGKNDVVSLDDILTTVPELEDMANNTPCSITGDGKYIQGFGITGMGFESSIFSYVFDYNAYTSGIDSIKAENTATSNRIYNINGQQVQSTNVPGLYIINGKKILK